VALTLAILIVAGVVLAGFLSSGQTLVSHVQMDKPPAAMIDRAQQIIQAFGFTEPVYAEPRDTAFGYSPWQHVSDWIWDNVEPEERMAALADPAFGAMSVWYRQSPVTFNPRPSGFGIGSFASGLVGRWNPMWRTTGEILVGLSPAGRLELFVRRMATGRRPLERDSPAKRPPAKRSPAHSISRRGLSDKPGAVHCRNSPAEKPRKVGPS